MIYGIGVTEIEIKICQTMIYHQNKTLCPGFLKFSDCDFFFYSNEHEPIHVHIRNADGEAKFNIQTMQWIDYKVLKNKDLKLAEALIEENKNLIIRHWHNYFK